MRGSVDQEAARLKFGDRLDTDHAAVGDDASLPHRKALAQPVDGNQTVGSAVFPGHILVQTVAVGHYRQNHPIEIGPVVLGQSAAAKKTRSSVLKTSHRRANKVSSTTP
jgi:hypothetical protein